MEFVSRSALGGRCAALLACACLLPAVVTAGPQDGKSLAERETGKRGARFEEAQVLLDNGDAAYTEGDYAKAVMAYGGALERLPEAPVTLQWRNIAKDRLITASIEQAHVLSRKGDVAGAKKLVSGLTTVAPGNPRVADELNQLNDPIRTNQALTAEHAAQVDKVRRLLYLTEGAFNLADYDQAKRHGEAILRIDPYNTAARRWLERVNAAKSEYFQAARDHTRSEMLMEVDKAWERPVDPSLSARTPVISAGASGEVSIESKIQSLIVPKVEFERTNLSEALDYVRGLLAKQADTSSINIVFESADKAAGDAILAKKFDLKLSNLPLAQLLRYMAQATETDFSIDEYAVRFHPAGAEASGAMVMRSYRVPPDFITSLSANAPTDGGGTADPFADKPAGGGGLLAQQRNAQDLLKTSGVPFPDGATARFDPASSTLFVRNTVANHELIAQIIQASTQGEPVTVAVRVTMLRTSQKNLKELGFDWLMSPFELSNTVFGSGGTTGNGSAISDLATLGLSQSNPVTAGNRSGDHAISSGSIDSLLRRGTTGVMSAPSRAPGVFGVNGLLANSTVQVMMRALDQKKGVDLMSQPSVLTRSGQAASVQIVKEMRFPEEYEAPQLPNSVGDNGGGGSSFPVTPSQPSSFTKRDIGVSLEVLPTASEDKNYIEVALNPLISEFDGFVNYGSPILAPYTTLTGETGTTVITANQILKPIISTHRINTKVTVADGATIVLGGLQKQQIQNVEDKTPILGDLPGVGRLFQSKAQSHETTVVMFFVQVELLDPTGRPYRQR